MENFHDKEQDFFHTKRSEIDRIDFGDVQTGWIPKADWLPSGSRIGLCVLSGVGTEHPTGPFPLKKGKTFLRG